MDELIQALQDQTKAINRLVSINAALIEMLAEQYDESEEEQPTTYLDGSKVQ